MLKNYFTIAIRNLFRNKLYSFINVFGLGTAIAICIVGYVSFEFSQMVYESITSAKDK